MASKSDESKKSHGATKSNHIWDEWDFQITNEGFDGLLESLSGALSAHEAKLYQVLGAIAAMAIHLRDNRKLWRAFCEHKFWQEVRGGRPKRDQYERSLKYVMRYSLGPTEKDRKNASRYVQAIAPLVEGGVKPEELPARIAEEGGIVALIRKWSRSSEKDNQNNDDNDNSSEDGPIFDNDSLFEDNGGSARKEPSKPPRTGPIENLPTGAPPPTVESKASRGEAKGDVYLMMKLRLAMDDRRNIIASDPVERKLRLEIEISDIKGGEVVAKVDRWEDLETQEQAQARLAK